MSAAREFSGIHPAFPVADTRSQFIPSEWNGLTKREYIAAQLLSGLLAARRTRTSTKAFNRLAADAIKHADELMLQLQATAE